jgi:cation diffusion facilitator CzcD-associated flavoprotein CzcO
MAAVDPPRPQVSVGIIGSGLSGLAALKQFKSEGFEVTAFEQHDEIGGLWNFREDPEKRSMSWYTMSNSSKYIVSPFCHLFVDEVCV